MRKIYHFPKRIFNCTFIYLYCVMELFINRGTSVYMRKICDSLKTYNKFLYEIRTYCMFSRNYFLPVTFLYKNNLYQSVEKFYSWEVRLIPKNETETINIIKSGDIYINFVVKNILIPWKCFKMDDLTSLSAITASA